jgi:hypothetical protein
MIMIGRSVEFSISGVYSVVEALLSVKE